MTAFAVENSDGATFAGLKFCTCINVVRWVCKIKGG
jgi:hypothetical protein